MRPPETAIEPPFATAHVSVSPRERHLKPPCHQLSVRLRTGVASVQVTGVRRTRVSPFRASTTACAARALLHASEPRAYAQPADPSSRRNDAAAGYPAAPGAVAVP